MTQSNEDQLISEIQELSEKQYEGLCRIAQAINNLADAINKKLVINLGEF